MANRIHWARWGVLTILALVGCPRAEPTVRPPPQLVDESPTGPPGFLGAGHLREGWRAQGLAAQWAGDTLVAVDGSELVELDFLTGTPSRARTQGYLIRDLAAASTNELRLMLDGSGVLSAVDPRSGSVRWQRPLGFTSVSAARSGNHLVVSGYQPLGGEAIFTGIDFSSGSVQFRVDSGLSGPVEIRLDGAHFVASNREKVASFNLATGARVWEAALYWLLSSAVNRTASAEGLTAFLGALDSVHVVSTATGQLRATIDFEGRVQLLSANGVLYLVGELTESRTESLRGLTVSAYSLASLTRSWLLESPGGRPVGEVLASAEGLFLRLVPDAMGDLGSEVIFISAASGSVDLRRPVLSASSLALHSADDGSMLVVTVVEGEIIALRPQPGPPPVFEVTIEGTVIAHDYAATTLEGLRVQVGDEVTQTDSRGQFSVSFTHEPGSIEVKLLDVVPTHDSIEVLDRPPAQVHLHEGQDSYRVTLHTSPGFWTR